MAIEVTCGQCHGRLLVETPGGVVACPHCGVHLEIPAPTPEPSVESANEPAPDFASSPEALLERDTAVEIPFAPGASSAPNDPGDIELNLETVESLMNASPSEVDADPFASTSVFGEPEEHDQITETGWRSAPNLLVGLGDTPPPIASDGSESAPALFTSPLLDRQTSPPPGSLRDQAMAMFPAFGESPRTTDPVWNFTPGEGATSTPDGMFLSASQQFSLGNPVDEPTLASEQPMFSFAEPAETSGLEATVALPAAATSERTITLPGESAEDLVLSSSQQFSLGAVAATIAAVNTSLSGANSLTATSRASSSLSSPTVSETAAAYAEEAAASRQKSLVLLLLVVGSYASAVTLILIYLLAVGRTHQLESLPDLKPPMNEKGEVTVKGYLSPRNDLPTGHVLKLGQSQRFGSVRVTPVKVTRGTVKFQHTSGKNAFELTDTEPLLKLWLKFENVSQDQTFSPLDELLVFKRSKSKPPVKVSANNFLAAAETRKLGKSIFRVYDLPTDFGFDMIGQKLDTALPPGETWQTYVPSEEEAVGLKGDLVWRVQIRKGYHPKSLRGVTTLIDVQFNSSDITDDRDTT